MALPTDAASLDEAEAAIEQWEFYRGRTLDEGQRLDVSVMLATRDDGLWAASVTGHEKPRQSGKGDSIECVEFWGLTQRSERILHTIHDAVLLATETQSRMLSLLEGHGDLRRMIGRAWKGTGQQMIEMRNGGVIWYRTRTGAGGRGIDEVDRLVVDEAQHAEHQHLAAITPTQAVSSNPQLNALGTGALDGKSAWWWSLRKQAKMEPGAFGYVGWSAQQWSLDQHGNVLLDDIDPSDRALWWATIPGLVAGRTTIEFLEREYRVLGPMAFAQEYLCVWAPPVDDHSGQVIPLDRWNELIDADAKPEDATVRLALDAPPDRTSATFAVGGKLSNGLTYFEVRDHISPNRMRDLVVRAKELSDGHRTNLILPPGSPALAWKPDFEAAGITVDVLTPAEFAAAFGYVQSQVADGTLRHRGQPELTNAVAGLGVKLSGDVEVPTRRSSSSNVAPFMAVCAAAARVPESVKKCEPWVVVE